MDGRAISFLIPALNEERNIGAAINSINKHCPSELRYEIVVADHGSSDLTVTISQSLGAKVIAVSGGAIGNLRNKLAEAASGELLIYNDADVYLTSSWGKRAKQLLSGSIDGIVGAYLVPPATQNWILNSWFWPLAYRKKKYVGTGHLWITRAAYERIGGFNSELSSGEDVDLCNRAIGAGYSVQIDPELSAIHNDFPTNIADFFRREQWHGVGDFASATTFMSSTVAIAALSFVILLIASVVAVFISLHLSVLFFLAVLAILFICSKKKFPALNWKVRLQNMSLWAIYLIARASSGFFRKKGRLYSTK